ncbi:MAG: DUF3892 domain-containing protein [Flavobacteriales bacterium]|nr:DUF3892 domain-containing protein [Flavobacteriales bacterium]
MKKIIDAKADRKGNITAVKLEGNVSFTPVKTAIRMAEKKLVDAVVVNPIKSIQHLRTRPDSKTKNNLDNLAGE